MATNTTNYNLVKQDEEEFYDVNVVNANLDKIDTAIKQVEGIANNIDFTPIQNELNNKVSTTEFNAHKGDVTHISYDDTITPDKLANTFTKTVTISNISASSNVIESWKTALGITGTYAAFIETRRGVTGHTIQRVTFISSSNSTMIFERSAYVATTWGAWKKDMTQGDDMLLKNAFTEADLMSSYPIGYSIMRVDLSAENSWAGETSGYAIVETMRTISVDVSHGIQRITRYNTSSTAAITIYERKNTSTNWGNWYGIATEHNYHKVSSSASYFTCSTASATAAKTASSILTSFSLYEGMSVRIKFSNGNTSTAPTLNLSSTGAKPILKPNGEVFKDISVGGVYTFVYDGSNFIVQGEGGEVVKSVQTGMLEVNALEVVVDVSAIDMTKSVLFVESIGGATTAANNHYIQSAGGEIISNSQIKIHYRESATNTGTKVKWTLIEYSKAKVQRGTLVSTLDATDVSISTVNLSKSAVFTNTNHTSSSTNVRDGYYIAYLSSNTNLKIEKHGDNNIHWQVVDFS